MFRGPFHMYSRGILREARDSPGLLLAGEPAAVEESRFDSGSLAYCSSARAEPIETEQEMRRGATGKEFWACGACGLWEGPGDWGRYCG